MRGDCRFNQCCIKGSFNIPSSSVKFGEPNIDSLVSHASMLRNSANKIVAVIGTEETDLEVVCINFIILFCVSYLYRKKKGQIWPYNSLMACILQHKLFLKSV